MSKLYAGVNKVHDHETQMICVQSLCRVHLTVPYTMAFTLRILLVILSVTGSAVCAIDQKTYYEILGLCEQANDRDIRRSYKEQAL